MKTTPEIEFEKLIKKLLSFADDCMSCPSFWESIAAGFFLAFVIFVIIFTKLLDTGMILLP